MTTHPLQLMFRQNHLQASLRSMQLYLRCGGQFRLLPLFGSRRKSTSLNSRILWRSLFLHFCFPRAFANTSISFFLIYNQYIASDLPWLLISDCAYYILCRVTMTSKRIFLFRSSLGEYRYYKALHPEATIRTHHSSQNEDSSLGSIFDAMRPCAQQ